jgi:seryl-tRNA synthetase
MTESRKHKKQFKVKFSRTGETTVMAHDAEEAKAHVETLMDEEDDIENDIEGAHQCTTIISAEEIPKKPEEDEDGR